MKNLSEPVEQKLAELLQAAEEILKPEVFKNFMKSKWNKNGHFLATEFMEKDFMKREPRKCSYLLLLVLDLLAASQDNLITPIRVDENDEPLG